MAGKNHNSDRLVGRKGRNSFSGLPARVLIEGGNSLSDL